MSMILVVKHPSGVKRTIQFDTSASLADVFTTASKQFNLNRNTHELKLGPKTLNLNDTIRGSRIPETVVLDIAPRSSWNFRAELDVLVKMGFSDEGYLYENCQKVMSVSQTLWDAVKVLVPSHMAYSDEDVCLSFLGVCYKGKKRLKTIRLVDLCGAERRLFLMCSRNYLQRPYRRSAHKSASRRTEAKESEKQAERKIPSKNQNKQIKARTKADEPKQKLKKKKNPNNKTPQHLPRSVSEISSEDHTAVPTLGNQNPGIVELSERMGRIYHGKYISSFTVPSDASKASFGSRHRILEAGNKMSVRIVFPNVAVLEGLFQHDETIKDVESFVKENIVEEAHTFYLYTVHPKLIVSSGENLGSMRSSPPGTLWYAGKSKGELFKKNVISSLEGRVFSYVSDDIPEESKFDLSATSSMYFWSLNQ